MLEAKGARPHFADGCFNGEQVAVARRTMKAAAGIDDGQDDLMLSDQHFERQPQGAQVFQAGMVEPAKIVGIKDDTGGVGVSPLNPVLDAVCVHEISGADTHATLGVGIRALLLSLSGLSLVKQNKYVARGHSS